MDPAKLNRLLDDTRGDLAKQVGRTRGYEKDDVAGAMSHMAALFRLMSFDLFAPFARFSNDVNRKIGRG